MNLPPLRNFASLILALGCLAGCATQKPSSAVPDYLHFIGGHPGAGLSPAKARASVARLQAYLGNLNRETVLRDTRTVYAPDVFFNDTLKTVRGSKSLEEYFLATVENTEEIKVAFTDVARSGNNFYLRWVMDVKFKKLKPGQTIRTIGMTHVRFDNQGRAILHQDYWDSTQGLFEHIPVLGGGIRFIKSKL